MDFVEIARRAGPETARRLQSNDYFDTHIAGHGREVDGERLDELTRGAVILGVEAVDYPLTDGLYIYMRLPAGEVISLSIEADGQDGDYSILRINETAII